MAARKSASSGKKTVSKKKGKAVETEIPVNFAAVVSAFARDPAVTRRKMFSSENVLAVNGKIFAMLNHGDLVLKLPRPRVDELARTNVGKYFDPGHGRPMKEWSSISHGAADWIELAKEAHRFVGEKTKD